MARVLDGNAIAAAIKAEVRDEVERLALQGIRPGLAAVLVGHVPASEIYVRSKVKTCEALGLFSELITPPETVTTDEMLALIGQLNAREDIDGILIQLPLPAHVNAKLLLEAVSPDKDVDGFHPVNVGRLQTGQPALAPCTAAGIIEILKRSHLPIAGQNAVVVGRSDIVGKPTAILLLAENATVTVCHSRTRDLASFTQRADILVVAIGKPAFVTTEMVKPGATILDAGINRITDRGGIRALLCRRCSPGRNLPAEGFGHCWRRASQSVRLGWGLYPRARRHRAADHRHADGEHGARGETPARAASLGCFASD